MQLATTVSRRAFIVNSLAAGGGLSVAMALPFATGQAHAGGVYDVEEINAWVVVRPDDTVVIRIVRAEMGQGTHTGLAQLVAEELECDWARVTTEFPTPGESAARKRAWGEFMTVGSRGIRISQDYVRKGGAAARMMLMQAAANEWKVPVGELIVSKGVITHPASQRITTYGKVAEAAAKLEPPKDIQLKDPSRWTIAGQPLRRLDTPDKVTGRMVYGIDVKLPSMLCAAIKDSPVFGNKLASFDDAEVKKMKGVKHVLRVGETAVAVVASTWWQAKTALDALPITWTEGPNNKLSSEGIAEFLQTGLDAEQAFIGNESGNVKAAIGKAAKKFEAVYSNPYQHHATMEPINATALWTSERCEVWTGTQVGEDALVAAVEASGLPAGKCDVHGLPLGGGFGRRSYSDYVSQAVRIAKQVPGTPIKLIWSREEDMQHGWHHPIMQAKLTGALDENGTLQGLHFRLSGQSITAFLAPQTLQNGKDPVTFQGLNPSGDHAFSYDIPNLTIDHAMRNPPIRPGAWRGVNTNHNAIFIECFMDELALAAGNDPLAFRRSLLGKSPKNLAVLNAAAERAGWDKPAPKGVYRGVAQMKAFGSYVAAVAEVSVDKDKNVKIHRIVGATDPGTVVNPSQVERQITGSFVYGLSALFQQQITIKDGRVVESNFHNYMPLQLAQVPKMETIIMPSGGFWGGVGEPTISVAAPAVLNAYFAATGERIRSFPLKNHGITLV